MAEPDDRILIIGAGLTGSRCAEALRAGGHRGRIRITGACGDVASPWRPWSHGFRGSGHWASAADGGRAVATAILGAPALPSRIHYAWSDAFDLRVQHVGEPPPIGATLELDACADDFEACFRIGGELRCAIVGNRPRRMVELRREVASSWSRGSR